MDSAFTAQTLRCETAYPHIPWEQYSAEHDLDGRMQFATHQSGGRSYPSSSSAMNLCVFKTGN